MSKYNSILSGGKEIMSKKQIHVIMDKEEYLDFKSYLAKKDLTISEWLRKRVKEEMECSWRSELEPLSGKSVS